MMERLSPSPKFQPIKFAHSRETKSITPEPWIQLQAKRKSFFCTASRKPGKLQTKTELWLCDAKMHTSKTVRTRNKHRGSSLEDFLKQEGLLEDVQAAAFKRALALKVNDLMKEKRMNKSAMAARMRTSRAAVHRLLDPKNTSVTLATLNSAARSLGCKVKIEFVPA